MRPGMANRPAAASTLSDPLASSSHVMRYGSRSVPLPRTVHQISNILVEPERNGDLMVYSNCQTMSYRHKTIDNFYCHYEHRLRPVGGGLKIVAKKIIVANDLIRDVLDFYRV